MGQSGKAVSIAVGVLIGLVAAEAGLRLSFHESEATRSYWGRGAFVADTVLGYRHAPSVTAYSAREGSFGPYAVTTNERGFRDEHPLSPGGETPPRIALGGASFTFGLGVGRYDRLMHVRIEERLRERGDYPPDIEVVNLSQTGYHLDQVCQLIEMEFDAVHPAVVLLAINEYDRFLRPGDRSIPDFKDGLRLYPRRPLKGGILDHLRAHSWILMRWGSSPMLNLPSAIGDQLLTRTIRSLKAPGAGAARVEAGGDGESEGDGQETTAGVPEPLRELTAFLDERGVPIVVAIIYRAGDRGTGLSRLLRENGYEVIDIRAGTNWSLTGDGHWNEIGHERAAEIVAKHMPPWKKLVAGEGAR